MHWNITSNEGERLLQQNEVRKERLNSSIPHSFPSLVRFYVKILVLVLPYPVELSRVCNVHTK